MSENNPKIQNILTENSDDRSYQDSITKSKVNS